jgi:hypothetical protein
MPIPAAIALFHQLQPDMIVDGAYRGWVAGFHGTTYQGQPVAWDLDLPGHRLALYFLASAWSRSSPWEPPVRQVVALQQAMPETLDPGFWTAEPDLDAVHDRIRDLHHEVEIADDRHPGRTPRLDALHSFRVIAHRFASIEETLHLLRDGALDAHQAFDRLHRIRGTGNRDNAWSIKILLIFRELRCQGWDGIPGAACCVPDQVVRSFYDQHGLHLPTGVLAASARIHADFGDLYDLPPFHAMLNPGG